MLGLAFRAAQASSPVLLMDCPIGAVFVHVLAACYSINVIGAFVRYSLERADRANFLESQLLIEAARHSLVLPIVAPSTARGPPLGESGAQGMPLTRLLIDFDFFPKRTTIVSGTARRVAGSLSERTPLLGDRHSLRRRRMHLGVMRRERSARQAGRQTDRGRDRALDIDHPTPSSSEHCQYRHRLIIPSATVVITASFYLPTHAVHGRVGRPQLHRRHRTRMQRAVHPLVPQSAAAVWRDFGCVEVTCRQYAR